MTDEINKTFEQLWEEAEKLTTSKYHNASHEKLIKELTAAITKYQKINELGTSDFVSSLKTVIVGELLFILSAITHKDNINIYPTLQAQILLNGV